MWLAVSSGVWGSGKRDGETPGGLDGEWIVGSEGRRRVWYLWGWRRREKEGGEGSVKPGDEGVGSG